MPLSIAASNLSKPSIRILALLMFLLPAAGVPSALIVQDTMKSVVLTCGVLVATLLWAGRRRPSNGLLHLHIMLVPPLMLLGYALASMLWSHPYMAGTDAARWCVLGVFLWLGLNTITRDNVHWLLLGIHCGATLASVWVALQFWCDFSLFPQGAAPAATFYNRNFFAEYAVCALPFSVWWMATLRSPRVLLPTAVSISLQITAILMTGTRSALLALVCILPLLGMLLLHMHRVHPWPEGTLRKNIVLPLLLGLVVLGNLPTSNPRILIESPAATPWSRSLARAKMVTRTQDFQTGSISVRTQMWRATARMVQDHPWFGVGAGAWEVHIPRYQGDDTTFEIDYFAHNEILQLLSEYGLIVGGLVLALLAAYGIKSTLITLSLSPSQAAELPARAVSLLSLTALGIVSFFGFPMHLASTTALSALSLALLASSDVRMASADYSVTRALPWTRNLRVAALSALVVALSAAVYISQRAFRAEYKIFNALFLIDQLPRTSALTDVQQTAKTSALGLLRDGMDLHPHYRKFTAQASEVMMAEEDWANAAWILQATANSHPYIEAIWVALTLSYANQGKADLAFDAVQHLKRLRPKAKSAQNLEILVLRLRGQYGEAHTLIDDYFTRQDVDYDLVQAGYALGIQMKDQPLVLRALALRARLWPEVAVDSYFRMGTAYQEMAPRNETLAREAFEQGLHLVPANEKANYLAQVPVDYRQQIR